MAVVAGIGGGNSNGVAGLPTPVLLALIGGGIGAVVLLRRKMGSSGSGTPTDQATLLPNTSIMLGSLQESLLNLQGQTGQGFANISDQLTGTQENLAAQIDAFSSQSQKGFTDLQNNLVSSSTTQTQSILDAFKQEGDALSSLISSNASAQSAYDKAFSDAVSKGFDNVTAGQNANLAALNNLQNVYETDTSGMAKELQGISGGLSGLINTQPGPWTQYNGKIIAQGSGTVRANPSNTLTYYVSNGKLYGIGDGATFMKLTGASQADYTSGISDKFITMVQTPDNALRAGMAGVLSGGQYLSTQTGTVPFSMN